MKKIKEFSVIAVKDKQDVLKAAELFAEIGVKVFGSDKSKARFIETGDNVKNNFLMWDDDGTFRIQSHFISNGLSVIELENAIKSRRSQRIEKPITISKEFTSCNILGLKLTHNGFQGGDEGHGGFVKIHLKDLASTSMLLNGKRVEEIELEFRGDTERETLVDALKTIVEELENNRYQS